MAAEPMIWRLFVVNLSPKWTLKVNGSEGNEWSQSTLNPNGLVPPGTSFSSAAVHTVDTAAMYNLLYCEIPGYPSDSYWGIWMGGTRDGKYPFQVGWTGNGKPPNTATGPGMQSFNKNVTTTVLAPSTNTRVLVIVFQGTDFGSYQLNPPPTVNKDSAHEVYFAVLFTLLSETAKTDPKVATFGTEFIDQKRNLQDTTYGKSLLTQLQASATSLQRDINNNTGDVKAEEQQLTSTNAFIQGMNITYTDVTTDVDSEQIAVTKREQVKPGDEPLPPLVRWAMGAANPSIDVGSVKIPIPLAPILRGIFFF